MTYPPPSPGEPLPQPVDPYDTPPYLTPEPQHQTTPLYQRPDYGQPDYGQTAYGQPDYGQPDYGQPDYGQPAYFAPFPPAAPASPPPARSRTTAIVLLSVAIAVVLLVGGGLTVYLVGTNLSATAGRQGGSPSSSPSQGSNPGKASSSSAAPEGTADPESTADPEGTVSIAEPKTLNGYKKLDSDEFESLVEGLEKEVEGYPGVEDAFGAVYGSVAEETLIAAFAAQLDIDDPRRVLDVVFQKFSGSQQLTGVSEASTGSLGGVAQCGDARTGDKTDVAICGWADEGSFGMFMFFNETAVDVKGDFPDMREEIETRD